MQVFRRISHEVSCDKTCLAENRRRWRCSDENVGRLWLTVFVLGWEMWLNIDAKCFRMHAKLVRCHEFVKCAAQINQHENFLTIHCTAPTLYAAGNAEQQHSITRPVPTQRWSNKKLPIFSSLYLRLHLFSADKVWSQDMSWSNPSKCLRQLHFLTSMTILWP